MKVILSRNKDRKSSILRSFFEFSYGTWVLAFINLLATPVTTFLISPEHFGKASMFTILYNFLINIVLLGTDQSFCRMYFEKSGRRRPSLLYSSIIFPIILTLIIGGIIIVGWPLLSNILFGEYTSLLLALSIGFSLLSGVIFRFGTVLLRMQRSANAYSILSILNGVFNVSFIILYCLFISRDFKSIIYAFLLANSITAGLAVSINFRFWKMAVRSFDKSLLKSVVSYGLPFVPVFIIDWMFQATDRFFLRNYTSFDDMGLYAASFKIVAALNMLQTGFNLFWVPFSYERYTKHPEDKKIYSDTFNILASILFIIVATIILFRNYVAAILDDRYQEINSIIPFLLFIPMMYILSEITIVGVNFLKKTKYHLHISVAALASNVLLNIWLVPLYGVKGAAIATSIAYIVFFACRTAYGNKLYKVSYDWIKFSVCLITILLTAIIVSFNTDGWINLFVCIASIIICFSFYSRTWMYNISLALNQLMKLKTKK